MRSRLTGRYEANINEAHGRAGRGYGGYTGRTRLELEKIWE